MEDEQRTEEQFVDEETFMVDDEDVQFVEWDNADPLTITGTDFAKATENLTNEPPFTRRY